MNAGPSGFVNAPVTKALFLTTTSSSIYWLASGAKNTGELIFGAGLLYYFRVLERQQGSAKFGGYTFAVTVVSYGLQKAFKKYYKFDKISTGPYGFILSSLLQFALDIPPLQKFSIFGIPLSDKAFTYLMGSQLMFCNGNASMMAALCGVLAGFAYRRNLFGIRRFRFPKLLNKLIANTIGRLLGGGPSRPTVVRHSMRQQQRRRQQSINNGSQAQPATVRVAVSTEAMQQLTSMGFNESQARTALQSTNNDVQAAISMLVDQA